MAVDYSIAAVGTLAVETPDIPLEALVLVDDRTVDPANAKVRIVHTSPNAGDVDIVVAQLGTEPIVEGLQYKADTGYLSLPAGIYDVSIREAGTTNELFPTQLDLSESAGTNLSVFAVGLLGDADTPFGVLPTVDAVPEPSSGVLALLGLLIVSMMRRRS